MQTVTQKIDFLSTCFGEDYALARDGVNVSYQCPSCGKGTNKKKLSINLDTWACHCWVCNIKGRTPYYIIKEFVSKHHAQKFKELFGINLGKKEEILVKEVLKFPSEFKMFASIDKVYDPDIRDCIKYLKSRGITEELMWYHKIGTFVGRRWSRRVVFPSFDINQNLTFYVSRSIDEDAFIKYQNCKADKTKIIFDEIRLNFKKELMIVEGVFDMIKCQKNTTCLLGSSLRSDHHLFQKIVENQTPVLLGLDSDMIDKSYKIASDLASYGVQVRILDTTGYHDVGSMSREIVGQKSKEAPIYSRESRLQHLIGTISSGSIF